VLLGLSARARVERGETTRGPRAATAAIVIGAIGTALAAAYIVLLVVVGLPDD
jgi:hypothetical protein